MASSYVATGIPEEGAKKIHNASPRTMKKMPWSSTSPTYSHDHNHNGIPMCVCAPPTHAGSFKCRLHRANAPAPHSPPKSSRDSVPSKTVEAQ